MLPFSAMIFTPGPITVFFPIKISVFGAVLARKCSDQIAGSSPLMCTLRYTLSKFLRPAGLSLLLSREEEPDAPGRIPERCPERDEEPGVLRELGGAPLAGVWDDMLCQVHHLKLRQ